MTRGRGRGRGVGIVNLTQRPRRCHNTVISEAEHFFIFRLQLETDIAKIKEILPRKYASMVSALPYNHCIYTDNTGTIKMLSPIRI
jgi:DNA helicase HerA-like ATPase